MGGSNPQLRGTGKMSEERAAWLRTYLGQMTYMRYDKTPDGDTIENGPNVVLYVPRTGSRIPLIMNITALTIEELDAMEAFFKLIFDEARPIVVERDRVAREAFDSGDDSFARVYRQLPQFIIRSRSEFGHTEGVHVGSEDLPEVNGGDDTSDDGLRGDSDQLAPDEPLRSGSEDLEQETD